MIILVLIGVLCIALLFPQIRVFAEHPVKTITNGYRDLFNYVKYKKWRECKYYGRIDVYTGLFGKGKTLSAVHKVREIYNKYNGLKVYVNGEWLTQEIHVISNVEIKGIPYKPLVSTEDIIHCHDGLNAAAVCIVLIDEASAQFNCRHFKTNISATLLNAMLTCRHLKFGMILTAQRFGHIDALIRQISSYVYECDKLWRGMLMRRCSAWDLENAVDIKLVKHDFVSWFVADEDYNAYDTSAVVEDIKRKQANGDLLTDAEVLELQGSMNSDLVAVSHKSKKGKQYCKI